MPALRTGELHPYSISRHASNASSPPVRHFWLVLLLKAGFLQLGSIKWMSSEGCLSRLVLGFEAWLGMLCLGLVWLDLVALVVVSPDLAWLSWIGLAEHEFSLVWFGWDGSD